MATIIRPPSRRARRRLIAPYRYDDAFMDFVDASASRSAKAFLESAGKGLFTATGHPAAVADFGCGRGAWLRQWLNLGLTDVIGVDGEYIAGETLLIPRERFVGADLSRPLDVGRRFDLVQCLEVAEHIAPECAGTLVRSLVRHGDLVMFSAATPGQGGEHHVNERPYSFWRALFAARGYDMYDAIRPLVRLRADIEPWYRYNTFVFATAKGAERLSPEARATLVRSESVATVAPPGWRMRCFMLARIPVPVMDVLARIKHRLLNMMRSASS
jgi:SAM-dependent methyltransferase